MLKIRLMRIGTKKRPFYRVVAVDERKKRTGGYLELLGTYNPLTEPKEIKLDQPKIDAWLKKGAQPSDGFLRIIGKAKQRRPRPAKKQKKEETPAVTAPVSESPAETPVEETTETSDQAPQEDSSVEQTPENSENSENQTVSEPENQNSDASDQTDTSDSQSTSERDSASEATPSENK